MAIVRGVIVKESAQKMYKYYYDNFLCEDWHVGKVERSIEYGMLKAINLMLFLNDEISKDVYRDMCRQLEATAEAYGILESKGRNLE